MPDQTQEPVLFMTPGEVARIFRVDPKTVTRWAQAGRLRSVKTPGGHRRFYRVEVEALVRSGRNEAIHNGR